MPKYNVGELIAELNEAVNKLNNLRTKHDDLEKENARLRAALKAADWVIEWTGADLLNGNPYSKVLASYREYRRAALKGSSHE
jgi:hypothetical protein